MSDVVSRLGGEAVKPIIRSLCETVDDNFEYPLGAVF